MEMMSFYIRSPKLSKCSGDLGFIAFNYSKNGNYMPWIPLRNAITAFFLHIQPLIGYGALSMVKLQMKTQDIFNNTNNLNLLYEHRPTPLHCICVKLAIYV